MNVWLYAMLLVSWSESKLLGLFLYLLRPCSKSDIDKNKTKFLTFPPKAKKVHFKIINSILYPNNKFL